MVDTDKQRGRWSLSNKCVVSINEKLIMPLIYLYPKKWNLLKSTEPL